MVVAVPGSEPCSSAYERLGGFSRTASRVISQIACAAPAAAPGGDRDFLADEEGKPAGKNAKAAAMGKRHEVIRWRRVASILPNNSNVTCSGSGAITDDTCGPLTISGPEASMILRRSLPELRQCPHEDSASSVMVPFLFSSFNELRRS